MTMLRMGWWRSLLALGVLVGALIHAGCGALPAESGRRPAPQVSWQFAQTGMKYGVPYGNVMAVVNGTPHLVYSGVSGGLKAGAAHAPPPEAISNCSVGWVDAYDHFYAVEAGGKVAVYFATDQEDGPSPYKQIALLPY